MSKITGCGCSQGGVLAVYATCADAFTAAVAGTAHYNLGCALQKQKKDQQALAQYKQAAKTISGPKRQSQAYYNMGTVLQGQKEYAKAMEAYKNALRMNPQNERARYNYVQCKRLLKQQQQQQKNQKQNKNQKDKNKNKDKKKDQNKQQNQKQKDQQKQKQRGCHKPRCDLF